MSRKTSVPEAGSASKLLAPLVCFVYALLFFGVCSVVCPSTALAASTESNGSGSARIYILPFNYMDAILIESDGHFGMVDSGESSDYPDGSDSRYPVRSGTTVGQGVEDDVIAFMRSVGVNSSNFDFYIGTHPHSDHIGTAPQVISTFKPARIYSPVYDDSMVTNPEALWDNQYVYDRLVSAAEAAKKEYGAAFIQRFDERAPVTPWRGFDIGNPHFSLGSAQIDIVNTNASTSLSTFADANCISLGVKVTAGGKSAFLSGDINNWVGAEDSLASELGHVDFLKLGHHGLAGSNSMNYIEALAPECVFQTGHFSSMPQELVDALWSLGAKYYSSDDVVDDGSAAFEVSLSSAGVSCNAEYDVSRLYSGSWRGGTYHMYRDGLPIVAYGWVQTGGGWTWFNGDVASYDSHWVSNGGVWYWIGSDGAMATAWNYIHGQWYCFSDSGAMQTGWYFDGSSWYWLDSDGVMATGWRSIDGSWYYFDDSGRMTTGWRLVGDAWYCLDGSGAMITGWLKYNGSWYYLGASGAMVTGWLKSGDCWYLFDDSGVMATGWVERNGVWYYLDSSGVMKSHSWVGDYYVLDDGAMATDMEVDGYYIGPDGKWVP